jgi:hypothetical protein
MSSQPRVVQTGALPPNTVTPFPAGSNNVYTAGVVTQTTQANLQNTLGGNNKTGGKKRYRGGANPPVVTVPPAPSYDPNKGATIANNTQIAGLAVSAQNNAAFDKTVNGNPGDTAVIAAQQQATYNGTSVPTKGGSKSKSRKHLKKGGSWPVWGCLSGGKKSRKSRRSRRRKTRKHVKRHRR